MSLLVYTCSHSQSRRRNMYPTLMSHSHSSSTPPQIPYQTRSAIMFSGSPIIACLQRAEARRINQTHANNSPLPAATADTTTTLPSITGDQFPHNSASRAPQLVLTIAARARIVAWMKQTEINEGTAKIASKAVRQFPQYFRGSPNANIKRAGRLWKQRNEFTGEDGKSSFGGALQVCQGTRSLGSSECT